MAQRADAARNRNNVLEATAELVAERGADELRIAEVAERAGVGAGTIYRSFGNRSGLLLALLDESERELQEGLIRGEPPLGPGAGPRERLLAFVAALFDLTVERREILAAADAGSADAGRSTGAYAAWRLHLTNLLSQLGHEGAEAEMLAELTLALLPAQLHVHLLDVRGFDPAPLRRELLRIADAIA